MKLQMISGCITDSLTANGKEEVDMTSDERWLVTHCIMNWLLTHPKENDRFLNFLMQNFIREFGDFFSTDKPCECCGDTICTWDIDV